MKPDEIKKKLTIEDVLEMIRKKQYKELTVDIEFVKELLKDERKQTTKAKDKEILYIKESYLRDLKECATKYPIKHWVWINATIKKLERQVK